MNKYEGERERRKVRRHNLDIVCLSRRFDTYWQRRRHLDPCGCASCAPSELRHRGRVCGRQDSWLRSGRRSGRRVAGTQHAVATPFLGGRKKKNRKQAHAAHPVESRPREYHHRVANQKRRTGRAQNRTITGKS